MRDPGRGASRARARRPLARRARRTRARRERHRDGEARLARPARSVPDPGLRRLRNRLRLAERAAGAAEVVLALPRGRGPELGAEARKRVRGRSARTLPSTRSARASESRGGSTSHSIGNAGYYPLSVRHSCATDSTASACGRAIRTTSSTPRSPGRCRDSERLDALDPALALLARDGIVPRALLERMRESCSGLVVANVQSLQAVPFLNARAAARAPGRSGTSRAGTTPSARGSSRRTVDGYVVQNDVMRDDLARFHGIPAERVVVTGWPQTDVFQRAGARARPSTRSSATLGLDPARPCRARGGEHADERAVRGEVRRAARELVAHAGPQPIGRSSCSVLIRATASGAKRFAAALGAEDVAVQEP